MTFILNFTKLGHLVSAKIVPEIESDTDSMLIFFDEKNSFLWGRLPDLCHILRGAGGGIWWVRQEQRWTAVAPVHCVTALPVPISCHYSCNAGHLCQPLEASLCEATSISENPTASSSRLLLRLPPNRSIVFTPWQSASPWRRGNEQWSSWKPHVSEYLVHWINGT